MSRLPSATMTHDGHNNIRVLFDCPAGLPVLFPEATGGVGGAEVRAVLFARALAASEQAIDVAVMVSSEMHQESRRHESMIVQFDAGDTSDPTRSIRGSYTGITRAAARLWSSMEQRIRHLPRRHRFSESLDFDLLVCFGVHHRTASLVRSARLRKRRVAVCLTSDRTLDDLHRRGRRDRGAYGEIGYLCRYAVRQADAVIVQTEMQQRSLMQDWGIASHLIRNPIQLRHVPCDEGWFPAARRTSPYVLWVGRADRFSKRGDLCLELARRCPEQSFVVVMNRGDRSEFDELTRDLPPNVLFYERVAPDKIETLYRHAALLVNTSTAEGFPNSFLQAGKFGVPILSWQVDPDGMLERQGCGVCCRGDFGQMPDRLRTLMNHGIDYHRHSRAVWEYVHQHHDLDQCATQFMQLVQSTVDSQLAKTLWPASPFPSNRPAQERCA